MSRPFSSRSSSSVGSFVRINGKIRAREVRVIGPDGQQAGVLPLHEAINLARTHAMDLVEVAPTATPPVCRVVDYGKYRYEQAKKEKESKKHQHANRVKEIQLTATIDNHDFGVKLGHATDFLCDEMRVKVSLRFRGREMAHQEFGMQVMERFIKDLGTFGQAVEAPKLVGRGLNVMLTPLPRNKRARNPRLDQPGVSTAADGRGPAPSVASASPGRGLVDFSSAQAAQTEEEEKERQASAFNNNPFAQLENQLEERSGS